MRFQVCYWNIASENYSNMDLAIAYGIPLAACMLASIPDFQNVLQLVRARHRLWDNLVASKVCCRLVKTSQNILRHFGGCLGISRAKSGVGLRTRYPLLHALCAVPGHLLQLG